MPTPTITRGEDHFFTTIYEGNGGGQKVGKFVPFTDNGTIGNSCRFENGGPGYLTKTYSGAGTSTKIFTFSCWFKLSGDALKGTTGYFPTLFNVGGETGKYFSLFYQSQYQTIQYYSYNSTYDFRGITVRTFEDESKWYHLVMSVDTTDSTAGDRVKLYIDGDRITSFTSGVNPSSDYVTSVGSADTYNVGFMNSGDTWDGYMAEVNYIDGTAYEPSTFGITDTSTGRWIPKTLSGINYGTNGFRLQFQDNSSMGDDTSGNTNDFTTTEIANDDQTIDSPSKNYLTFTRSGQVGSNGLSEGNLKPNFPTGTGASAIRSSFRIPVGKWYFEYYIPGTNSVLIIMAVAPEDTNHSDRFYRLSGFKTLYPYTRTVYEGNVSLLTETNMPIGEDDVTYGVYIERKTDGTVNYWVGDDQASKGTFAYSYSGNPATGANPVGNKFRSDENLRLFCGSDGNGNYSSGVRGVFNFGQLKESPIDSGTTLTDYTSTAGGFFRYQPADGFKALSQDNFPETDKGIPDLTWIKNRDQGDNNQFYDSSRGVLQDLHTDLTNTESTTTDGLQKFIKGGVSIEDDVSINTSGESYVAWNWIANNESTDTNTDGETTSVVQVNSTAKFSIGTFTSKVAEQTIGHGLGVAPDVIIMKCRSTAQNWFVYHKLIDETDSHYLHLNATDAEQTGSDFGNAVPTSSTFEANPTGVADRTYCFWAFKAVDGFSKFGKYSGNGNANGAMVYTGFKPAWVMIKCFSTSGNGWTIHDNKRMPFNGSSTETTLYADASQAEQTSGGNLIDFLSNGFKLRGTNTNLNGTRTYVYFAFAEHPFIGDGRSPATAR